jgi:hypothetical protein
METVGVKNKTTNRKLSFYFDADRSIFKSQAISKVARAMTSMREKVSLTYHTYTLSPPTRNKLYQEVLGLLP